MSPCSTPILEFVRPCNLCPHMKRITLGKIRRSLETMTHAVTIEPTVAARARRAVERMLAIKLSEDACGEIAMVAGMLAPLPALLIEPLVRAALARRSRPRRRHHHRRDRARRGARRDRARRAPARRGRRPRFCLARFPPHRSGDRARRCAARRQPRRRRRDDRPRQRPGARASSPPSGPRSTFSAISPASRPPPPPSSRLCAAIGTRRD